MVRTNGKEFKAFYNDRRFWPEGTYYEDESIFIDGVECDGDYNYYLIPDDVSVVIRGGVVFRYDDRNDAEELESYFKRWRKKVKERYIVIAIDHEKVDRVKKVVTKLGGKIY